MIKVMIVAGRRDGMTHEEYRRYLVENHGPLILSLPALAGDFRHYHYNFPVPGATDTAFSHPLATDVDNCMEASFDSLQAFRGNMARPEYIGQVRPDEDRFAGAAVFHLMTEQPVLEGQRTTDRALYFRRRAADLTREEFQRRWLEGMGAIFNEAGRPAGVAAYLQNHTIAEADMPDGGDPKYYDVIDEFYLDGPGGLAALGAGPAVRAAVRRLEEELLDPSRTRAFVVEAHVNI